MRASARRLREATDPSPRSLYALVPERALDAFTLRQEQLWLAPLVDAEYGSATFIAAERPAVFELRVSTTGLLVREVAPTTAAAGWCIEASPGGLASPTSLDRGVRSIGKCFPQFGKAVPRWG